MVLRTLFPSGLSTKDRMYILIYKELKIKFIFLSRNFSGAHSLASGLVRKSAYKEVRFIEIGE